MTGFLRSAAGWLNDRTGISTGVRRFLFEEIPASSGWRQVFGSVALFLILMQGFTGVLLAFNYAATSGEAYSSVRYILTEVTGGKLIHGLHHFGASMIIVVAVLHMMQVFLYGSYKKPREATWICGVVLLVVILGFGLTGYLLPWDNRAYWGTVVTTRMVGQTPLAGPYLMRLLGSDGAVTAVTFARFYGLHVLVFPAATVLLVFFHVYLVRRHGVAPVPGDEFVPKKQFYPRQVFKDTIAIFVAFAALFTMAMVVHVPLEQLADPSDSSYVPRPEWYFLFLFQTLKLFSGPLEVVGSVVLPSLAMLVLILVPFLDRGGLVKVTKRTVAFLFIVLAMGAWGGLTFAALASTPKQQGPKVDYSGSTEWLNVSPEDLAAIAYFREENCGKCHYTGSRSGPDLASVQVQEDVARLGAHFKTFGRIPLSKAQVNSLAALVERLDSPRAAALENAPDFATAGAVVYQRNYCFSCHIINGVGAAIGPALNGLARRRSRSWVEQHFINPRELTPETPMPAFRLTAKDLANLTDYLFSLDEGHAMPQY